MAPQTRPKKRQARRRVPRRPRSAALIPRDARLRFLAENSRDIYFSMRFPEGRYEYISPAVTEWFGFTPQDFYRDASTVLRCVAPAWRDQVRAWIGEIAQGQAADEYEFQVIDKAGRLRWMHQRQVLVPTPDHRGWLLQGLASDITELREAQRELRTRETRFCELIEAWPEQVMLRVNLDKGRHEYVSPSMELVLGYTPQEFYDDPGLGMRVVAPHWQERAWAWIAELKQGAIRPVYEFELVHKNGRHIWIHQVGVLRPRGPGQDLVAQFTFRDITEERATREALRRSEEHYRQLAESWADQVIVRIDLATGRPEYVSPGMERLFGHKPEAMCSDTPTPHLIVAPEWRESIAEWLEENRKGKIRSEYQYELIDAWGRRRWVSARGVLVNDDLGRPVVVQLVLFDITERKHLEDALRLSNERYTLLSDNLADVIWATDENLRWTYLSPSAEALTGMILAELMPKPFEEIFTPDSLAVIGRIAQDWLMAAPGSPEDGPRRMELELYHATGVTVPTEVVARPLRDADGRITGYCGATRDITERKRAEEALLASERRFSELIRYSSDSVTILDENGIQVFVSNAVERMLGYTPEELMGIPVIEKMLHPDDQARVTAAFAAIIKSGVGGVQYRHRHRNGSWVHMEAWGTNQLDNPDICGIVVNVRDITERKRMEEELRRNQARFEALFELSRLTSATEAQMAAFTLREALRLSESTAGVLFFVSPDDAELRPLAWQGWEHGPKPPAFPTLGPTPWAAVHSSRQPLVLNDFSAFAGQIPQGHLTLERFLGVPALDGDHPAAILGLTGKVGPYTADDSLQVSLLMDGMWRIVRSRRDEERIRASLREKEALLREVHHRVKNNLQVVSSLLDMAGRRLSVAEARQSMEEVRAKVQAMSLIHSQLQSADGAGGVSLEPYVRALFRQLREIYSGGMHLSLRVQLSELMLGPDQAAPLGLALNEVLANVFKHACPPCQNGDGRAGHVEIRAWQDPDAMVTIEVSDDGPGLPAGLVPERAGSLGMKLMFGLVRRQLGGELSIDSQTGGVRVRIRFRPNIAP